MNQDTLNLMCHARSTIGAIYTILCLASYLVWISVFYILLQITRLKFLRLIIAGNLFFVLGWAITYRGHFIGYPHDPSTSHLMIMATIQIALNSIGLLLDLAGACYGLRFLQRKWAEKESANQRLEATPSSSGS